MSDAMSVGFVGLGNMGHPMATNILKAGHRLTVSDLREDAAKELLDAGAAWAPSAREVAAASEVIFLSLPGPADVRAVVQGDDGVVAGAARGSTIVDLSTNSPAVVQELAAYVNERGLRFLDAPVSGGVVGARRATLTVMVGGDAEVFAHCRPLLDAIGSNVFHIGAVGSGNVVKLVNNMLAFIGMMGTVEALVLGVKAGVDPKVLRDVITTGSGSSTAWANGSRAILRDRLAPTFTVNLASKDISLAADLGRQLGVPLPMGSMVEQLIVGYRDGGRGAEDLLATVKAIEEQAGIVVRGLATDLP